MKKNFSNEVIIGLTAIVSLALLYIGVNYLKGVNMFKPSNYYYVACNNVRGITISSPVYVDGFKVGLVRGVDYDYDTVDKITVEISLDKGMRVNRGSYVSIESTFLSGAELHIILNKYVTEYYKRGETIEGRLKAGVMTSIEEDLWPQLTGLIPKIDSVLTGLQLIVSSEALLRSLDNIERMTQRLDASSQRLDNLLRGDIPEITKNLKLTTANFATISDRWLALDLQQSLDSFNSTLLELNTLTARLGSKNNSLGLLLNDTLLYNNLNHTLNEASELLLDIRQNPKKYVKLSLF